MYDQATGLHPSFVKAHMLSVYFQCVDPERVPQNQDLR